jgi:hypothetical protein
MAKAKTNTNAVKLTLTDLINKKLQKKSTEVKYKNVYVSKLDGELTFKIPTEDEMFSIIDELGEDKSTKHIKEIYTKMIYRQCDMLHEKDLTDAYGITRGFDIVEVLFTTNDILNTGNSIMDEANFDEKEQEIKN